MTFGSLFAGIGGLDLGLERAGMKCAWQVEIDDYAQRVLAKHWPTVRRWDDVRTWPQPDTEHVDLICGGFPCQDISVAGKRAGIHGERSGLFFEAIRVVGILRPRWVLLENVAALLANGMGAVVGELAELGYCVEWHCIPAAAVGAPHIRNRVFIVAYSARTERGEERPGRCGVERRNNGLSSREKGASRFKSSRQEVSNTNSQRLSNRQGEDADGAGTVIRAKPARSSWWDIEPSVGRVVNGFPGRVDRIRCLGNAVVPQVAEFIGRQIASSDK